MKVFENVPQRILALFNSAHGTALTLDQVEFKNPRPTSSITPKPNTERNTAVTLAMLPNAAYTGETVVYYDRMSLSKAWLNAPLLGELAIPVENETTVHLLLPKLYQRLGAKFLPADLVDSPLGLTTHTGSVVLRAAETSLSWTDSVEIGLWSVNRPAEFSVQYPGKLWLFDDSAADAITSPKLTSRYSPVLQTYRWDYSSQADFLKTLVAATTQTPVSSTVATNLAAALKAVDGQPWVYSASIAPYNLSSCTIYYNGKVSDYPAWLSANQKWPYIDPDQTDIGPLQAPLNPEYDNVALIQDNRPWVDTTGYRNFLIIHYNNPL